MNKPDLALFDFDGTITTGDSFLLFMQKNQPLKFWLTAFCLAPQVGLFFASMYPNERLKTDFLRSLFMGVAQGLLLTSCEQFNQRYLPFIIREKAILEIKRHKNNGATVVVVTASPRILVQPFCIRHNLTVIGTELAFDDQGRFTGRLAGKNCRGVEKVRRIREMFDLDKHGGIHAYGDSDGDREMLQLASPLNRHFKPFRD